jgi:hypothetical protein
VLWRAIGNRTTVFEQAIPDIAGVLEQIADTALRRAA